MFFLKKFIADINVKFFCNQIIKNLCLLYTVLHTKNGESIDERKINKRNRAGDGIFFK